MKYRELEPVVLTKDLEDAGLKAGDLGAVVHVYGQDGLEVEFVTASGKSKALLTLSVEDVRKAEGSDLLSVRRAVGN